MAVTTRKKALRRVLGSFGGVLALGLVAVTAFAIWFMYVILDGWMHFSYGPGPGH
jgi:uncharacterized membrane protein